MRRVATDLLSILCVSTLFFLCGPLFAGERDAPTAAERPARQNGPNPSHDDADLHDVQFLGSRLGWAVGDRGVVWHTGDKGHTWEFVPCPTDAALRSVSFITERVGWVAGRSTLPYVRVGVGVLFATVDGGRTWTKVDRENLPALSYVRFFNPNDGVVVGEASSNCPTGVLTTRDGGATWQPVEGTRHSGWRAADFVNPNMGVVAGLDGSVARVAQVLTDPRAGGFGPRGLYDVKLAADGSGWLVGDGSLVLATANRGVVWQSPPSALPDGTAEIFDFRAVAVRGSNIWIAGSPGSVIWHSADGGTTWTAQPTAQTTPIDRIVFPTDRAGWAVGAFGSILHTEDGGATWHPARAGNRRAAILAVHARADEISFNLLAKESADLGYRGVVLLPFRGERPGQGYLHTDVDLKLHDAVAAAGGARGIIGWQFPLGVPGLDRDAQKLRADWMRRTEGRFQSAFLGQLVCQIRTWRPSVVVVERPAADDAAGSVLVDAVVDAVRQAGDPAIFPRHGDLAALRPWTASRIFARVPDVGAGDFIVDAHENLPRLNATIESVGTAAASRLRSVDFDAESDSYRLVEAAGRETPRKSPPRDFFAGLAIATGSDARRALPTIKTETDELAVRTARQSRDFAAVAKKRIETDTHGSEILATLRAATRGTPAATAALRYAMLADLYRQNGKWDLAEAALCELVDRYPNEPPTLDAMKWLLQYWVGAEFTYQRLRRPQVEMRRAQFNPAVIGESIERAIRLAQSDRKNRAPEEIETPDPLQLISHSGPLRTSAGDDWLMIRLKSQRNLALRMARLVRERSPALFRTPEVQLPLAALLRQSGLKSLSRAKPARNGTRNPEADAFDDAVIGIDQETQKTVDCRTTAERPRLDGLLSDRCWQEAAEIPLAAGGAPLTAGGPHALVMLARDAQYLYFAISVPRAAGLPADGPASLGRTHDQDLSAFDRVALSFDVDRDYVTSYTIEIDQRGCVADTCWNDARWNPERMWIKAQADDRRWRVEGAIAFDELVAQPPRPGDAWGLAVVRTIPAERQESWSGPAVGPPAAESLGLIRFK